MKSSIIRIGNSRGIRIPKPLLDQIGLNGDVEILVENDTLVIGPARKPREGWTAAFRQMAENGDDRLLDAAPISTRWERDEWEWQ